MSKYIDAEKLIAEIERLKKHSQEAKMEFMKEGYSQNAFAENCRLKSFDKLLSFITSLQQEQKECIYGRTLEEREKYCKFCSAICEARVEQEQREVSVECYVRVYPTLDNKPRPWVSLCKHGISCNSIRDIPELENLGFKDDDTAIVTIKKK